ncbi:MAG: ribonuclease Z [Anaerolineae bacterium]
MFEIVFLGTSASAPSVHRGLSSQMVLYNEHRFLIDCGEGTQRQVLKSGLGFKRLDKILITHGHLDHILGLGGLISTFTRWEAIEHVEIYAGYWALERVKDLLLGVVLRGERTSLRIDFIPLEPGVLMEDDKFQLRAFPVSHRGPDCYGFSFEEKPHRPFLVDKAEALRVPAGPERSRLVRGSSITLKDGRIITPDQVLGEPVPGAKLVFVGDAGRTDNLVHAAEGADLLVIEATYLEIEADIARQFGHLTAAQAAQLAVEAHVRQLCLTHISRRYHAGAVLAEAQAIFPNTCVANDFDHFRVSRR